MLTQYTSMCLSAHPLPAGAAVSSSVAAARPAQYGNEAQMTKNHQNAPYFHPFLNVQDGYRHSCALTSRDVSINCRSLAGPSGRAGPEGLGWRGVWVGVQGRGRGLARAIGARHDTHLRRKEERVCPRQASVQPSARSWSLDSAPPAMVQPGKLTSI